MDSRRNIIRKATSRTPMLAQIWRAPFAFLQIATLILLASCSNDITEPPCFNCPMGFSAIDSEPAWSPDGQWIAFGHGDTSGKEGIYLITPDGQLVKQWHQGAVNSPSWSPDGQWIAFSQNNQIWKKKVNGDSLTQLTFEGKNFYPTWSPDGQWIAFDGLMKGQTNFYAIWKIRNNGENRTLITPSTMEYGDIRMPNWVGGDILHIRYGNGMSSSELFVMDINGNDNRRITINRTTDYYPKYSSSKTRIAFTSKDKSSPLFQIWTMNADGSDLKQVTNRQGYSCDWSPDETRLVYTDSRVESGRLWIMEANGSNNRQLTFEYHF